MRVEPFDVGSVVHVIKRGARGMEIVRDDADKWRFTRSLYLLNDEYQDPVRFGRYDNLKLESKSDLLSKHESFFARPDHWPERNPLVSVLAWTLMPNHFHLLLSEVRTGGISKFMQRLCGSMSASFNKKYQERGSIFQGSYKGRTVDTTEYLQYVIPYIAVKNVFELYPDGLKKAVKEFDKAWAWAETYPFSSFQTNALGKVSPVVDIQKLQELGLQDHSLFRRTSRDMLLKHLDTKINLSDLLLEEW